METLSLDTILAILRANQALAWSLLGLGVALAVLARYWDEVRYFALRVWHRLPIIGTVDRLAKKHCRDEDGWPSVEKSLCGPYYTEYSKHAGDLTLYNSSHDYLAKVGEAGRKPTPLWVYVLAVILLVLEAVGFAFVIGPWVNPNVSATQMSYLAWSMAFFLALISGGLAHFAGVQLHYNSLIAKAHAWWRAADKKGRSPKLKQLRSLPLDRSYEDNDEPDYNQIMARLHVNAEVSQKKNWVIGFFTLIFIFAVAAFWIRAETLKSIETEMVSSLKAPEGVGSVSIFELPSESNELDNTSVNTSITEQMDAIRSASLMTYIVLSVIYLAIQSIMLWLAIAYGFKGIHSRSAWEYTHKFKSAHELDQWLETQRNKICGHANEKLRSLQQKRSHLHTTDSDEDDSSTNTGASGRHFLAYVSFENRRRFQNNLDAEAEKAARKASSHAAQNNKSAPTSERNEQKRAETAELNDAELAKLNNVDISGLSDDELSDLSRAKKIDLTILIALREQQTLGLPVAANEEIDAATFRDLTGLEEAELVFASSSLKLSVEVLTDIRSQQLVLKKLGMFGAKVTA